MRKKIFNILSKLYPTYAIGQHEGLCTSPYLVLKFNEHMTSMNNSSCGWQLFKVLCYCPKSSIAPLDEMIDKVKQALTSNGFENTGNITPDFLDDTKQAFMRSIEFRIPKEV